MRDFEQTVKDYSPWLRTHAARRCTDGRVDPEELLQETWIEAWRLWPKIGGYKNIGGMLIKVMVWIASRLWRAGGAAARQTRFVSLDEWDASTTGGQEDAVLLRDTVAAMQRSLPAKTVDMMTRVALGDSYREIAADAGVVYQACQQRVEKGRARLRDLTGS